MSNLRQAIQNLWTLLNHEKGNRTSNEGGAGSMGDTGQPGISRLRDLPNEADLHGRSY